MSDNNSQNSGTILKIVTIISIIFIICLVLFVVFNNDSNNTVNNNDSSIVNYSVNINVNYDGNWTGIVSINGSDIASYAGSGSQNLSVDAGNDDVISVYFEKQDDNLHSLNVQIIKNNQVIGEGSAVSGVSNVTVNSNSS